MNFYTHLEAMMDKPDDLKKWQQAALERWAKLKGCKVGDLIENFAETDEGMISGFYYNDDKCIKAIDPIFVHTLIKALDADSKYPIFRGHLRNIVFKALNEQGIEEVNVNQAQQSIQCAEVDQILEALYTMGGE